MRRFTVGLCFLALGGCSFALVSGPPSNHRELPVFECTQSRVAPVLDTIWTALMVLNFVSVVGQSDAEWDATEGFNGDPPFSRKTALGMYTVFAALGGAGMYYGYSTTSECKRAKADMAGRIMQGQGGQPGWPLPGPSPQPGQPGQPGTWPPPAPPTAPMPPPAPTPPTP